MSDLYTKVYKINEPPLSNLDSPIEGSFSIQAVVANNVRSYYYLEEFTDGEYYSEQLSSNDQLTHYSDRCNGKVYKYLVSSKDYYNEYIYKYINADFTAAFYIFKVVFSNEDSYIVYSIPDLYQSLYLSDISDNYREKIIDFVENNPTDLASSGVYTKDQIDTLLTHKQDTLIFDSTPTINSTNPVTSNGIYQYINNITLANLADVNITNVTDNQSIIYNNISNNWENANIVVSDINNALLTSDGKLLLTSDGKFLTFKVE